MKEIYSHPDYTRVGYFESVLKEAGIRCYVQNATTHNLLTGIPSHLFYPKLCIIDDEDLDAAIELLKPLQEKADPMSAGLSEWVCRGCGETVPAGFETCWKCEATRPGAAP